MTSERGMGPAQKDGGRPTKWATAVRLAEALASRRTGSCLSPPSPYGLLPRPTLAVIPAKAGIQAAEALGVSVPGFAAGWIPGLRPG